MAYEWLTSFCREAQLVVKTDDDVLVNIYQLIKELDSLSPADLSSSKIWCWIHRNESAITDVTSRYYASPIAFPMERSLFIALDLAMSRQLLR